MIKFAQEDLDLVLSLSNEYRSISEDRGQIELAKYLLEKDIVRLNDKYDELLQKQQVIAKTLQEKYGPGTLNIETGEFTAIQQ